MAPAVVPANPLSRFKALIILLNWPQSLIITQNSRPKQIHRSTEFLFIQFTQADFSAWLTTTEHSGPVGLKKKHDPPTAMDASYQALYVLSARLDMAAP